MKIKIERYDLITPLSQVVRAAASRSQIPILEGVLIESDGESLRLTCMDNEITISTSISKFEASQSGPMVLPAKVFHDLVKKFSDNPIIIETKEHFAQIECGTTKIKLPLFPADEFPSQKKLTGISVKIDGEKFVNLVESTMYAVGKNIETSPVLMGINITINHDRLEAAATDRYRLAKYTIDLDEEIDTTITMVVPVKALDIVSKLKPEVVQMRFTPREIHFSVDGYEIRSRLLDGVYPDISRVIPTVHKTTVVVNRQSLLKTLDIASEIVDADKKLVILYVSDDSVLVTTKNHDGEMEEKLDAEVTGENVRVGVNIRYLIDAIKVIPSELIEMRIKDQTSPIVVQGANAHHNLHLVLPIRITGDGY